MEKKRGLEREGWREKDRKWSMLENLKDDVPSVPLNSNITFDGKKVDKGSAETYMGYCSSDSFTV